MSLRCKSAIQTTKQGYLWSAYPGWPEIVPGLLVSPTCGHCPSCRSSRHPPIWYFLQDQGIGSRGFLHPKNLNNREGAVQTELSCQATFSPWMILTGQDMSKLSGADTSTSYLTTIVVLHCSTRGDITSCCPQQSPIWEAHLPFDGWWSHVGLPPPVELLLLGQGLPCTCQIENTKNSSEE